MDRHLQRASPQARSYCLGTSGINANVGVMTGATSFRTIGCRPSGPAALDVFRPASNLRTPLSVTWMLGILANLRFKNVPGSEEKF